MEGLMVSQNTPWFSPLGVSGGHMGDLYTPCTTAGGSLVFVHQYTSMHALLVCLNAGPWSWGGSAVCM